MVRQVTHTMTPAGGGIPPVINGAMSALRRHGVITTCHSSDGQDARRTGTIRSTRSKLGGAHRCHNDLWSADFNPYTVVHIHGLWSPSGLIGAHYALRHNFPLVLSPHGMMDPWAWRRSVAKKLLALAAYQRRVLASTDCFHALCEEEAAAIRHLGYPQPIAIIPNGVSPPADVPRKSLTSFQALHNHKKIALYLGRVHPKKGLPLLIEAWMRAGASTNDWKLLIVGPDELSHKQELLTLIEKYNSSGLSSISILPPAYAEDKALLLKSASLFILPSLSEGFSMAVLEAMAASTTCLITSACNFPEIDRAHAGMIAAPSVGDIKAKLEILLNGSDLKRMATNAANLANNSYSWHRVSQMYRDTYAWLLDRRTMPDFVSFK